MSIRPKTEKASWEFQWVPEQVDGKVDMGIGAWNVKFHHTVMFGETISITYKKETVKLPAEMFPDITDFLRSKGLLKLSDFNEDFSGGDGDWSDDEEEEEDLPVPDVGDETEDYKRVELPDNSKPVYSLDMQDIDEDTAPARPVVRTASVDKPQPSDRVNSRSEVPETPPELKGKAREMMAQRMKATKKAKTRSIKKMDEGEEE